MNEIFFLCVSSVGISSFSHAPKVISNTFLSISSLDIVVFY